MLRKTAMNENKKIAEVAQSVITAAELSTEIERLRIGFIPFCDAVALIVAADKGFMAAEASTSSSSAKCPGRTCATSSTSALFDAAHLIAPVAIASSLGLGHVKGFRSSPRSRSA